MSFFLKFGLGFILLLIAIVLWYITIPIIVLYIVHRKRQAISLWYQNIKKNSKLNYLNLPEYIAIDIFGSKWSSILKFSDLKLYNYLTDFYTSQNSMITINKSFIQNVIALHSFLHDKLIANSKDSNTTEFAQTYEFTQRYFQDCILNYDDNCKDKEQEEESSEQDSYYWHDRWNQSYNSSYNNSYEDSHKSSHKNRNYSNSKKSRKSAEKEARIKEKLDKFGISKYDAEAIFGKSWRTKFAQPDSIFFYTVQTIATNVKYDYNGRYKRKYGPLYFKVLEIIKIIIGENNAYDYQDYTNDSTDDSTDDSRNDSTQDESEIDNKEFESAFKILGLKNNSTMDEIKMQYHKLILIHHPDRNRGSKKSSLKTVQINNAYDLIMGVKNTA